MWLCHYFFVVILGLWVGGILSSSQNVITFGQSADFTSINKVHSTNMRTGILAAFEEANQQGYLPFNLSLISYDDALIPQNAIANTQKLHQQDNVFGLIGSVGTATVTAAFPYIIQNNIPLVGPYTGAASLRSPFYPEAIHIRASYADEATAMVHFLVYEKLLNRIAVLYTNDSFGQSAYASFVNALNQYHLTTVKEMTISNQASSWKSLVKPVKSTDPQAIVLFSTTGNDFIPSYKSQVSYDSKVLFFLCSTTPMSAWSSFLDGYQDNIYITQVMPSPNQTDLGLVQEFHQALSLINSNSSPDFDTLEGYLGGRFVVEAFRRMQLPPTPATFLDIIYTSSIFRINEMYLGPVYYDSSQVEVELNMEQSEIGGCNQGMKTVWIRSFNTTSQSLEDADAPFTFYGHCSGNGGGVPMFVIFATLSSASENANSSGLASIDAFNNGFSLGLALDPDKRVILFDVPDFSPQGDHLSSLGTDASVIPWYSNVIGYIGNLGDEINSNSTFLRQELDKGRIFIGMRTGKSLFRDPNQPLFINLRASFQDEFMGLIHVLLDNYQVSKVALILDDSSEAYQALAVITNEVSAYRLSLHGTYFACDYNPTQQHSWLEAILQGNDGTPPQAVILIGNWTLMEEISLLLWKQAPTIITAYSSLTSVTVMQLAVKNSMNMAPNVFFSTPFPSFVGHESSEMVAGFTQVYNLTNTDFDQDMNTYEGYILASFVTELVNFISGSITGYAMEEELALRMSSFVKDYPLGPFFADASPTNDTIVFCNQGLHSVYFYSLNNYSLVIPLINATYSFQTCGSTLSDAQLNWVDLSQDVIVEMVAAILILSSISVICLVMNLLLFLQSVVFNQKGSAKEACRSAFFCSPYSVTILLGTTLGLYSVFPYIGEPQVWKCTTSIWISRLPFALTLGGVLARLRYYQSFQNSKNKDSPDMKEKEMNQRLPIYKRQLVIIISTLVVEVILLIIESTLFTPTVRIDETSKWKYCSERPTFRILFGVFHLVLVTWIAWMSYRLRNIPARETPLKVMRWMGFWLFFILLVLIIVWLVLSEENSFIAVALVSFLAYAPLMLVTSFLKALGVVGIMNKASQEEKTPLKMALDTLGPFLNAENNN